MVIDREQWLKEAEAAERAGAPSTCAAIVRHSIWRGVEDDDRKRTWMDDAQSLLGRDAVETARAVYAHALTVFPTKAGLWKAAVDLERRHGKRRGCGVRGVRRSGLLLFLYWCLCSVKECLFFDRACLSFRRTPFFSIFSFYPLGISLLFFLSLFSPSFSHVVYTPNRHAGLAGAALVGRSGPMPRGRDSVAGVGQRKVEPRRRGRRARSARERVQGDSLVGGVEGVRLLACLLACLLVLFLFSLIFLESNRPHASIVHFRYILSF